jgi:hypothetical protein
MLGHTFMAVGCLHIWTTVAILTTVGSHCMKDKTVYLLDNKFSTLIQQAFFAFEHFILIYLKLYSRQVF